METDIQRIAALSIVDEQLDEMHEELGDLPREVKRLERLVREKIAELEEIQKQRSQLDDFRKQTSMTFQDFTDKETKLNDTQSSGAVRNNKEFDAITKEIEFIRSERSRLELELGINNATDENLLAQENGAKAEVAELKENLLLKETELDSLSSEQNVEFKKLHTKRKEITASLNSEYLSEYERIRTYHNDAAVATRKGSCSGCFSSIPAQKQVEMRNNLNGYYTCMSCGRILYPEALREFEIEF